MPPAAATEWERTGWTLLRIATLEPASAAASAARWPARPAPMINTSCAGMDSWGLEGEGRCLRPGLYNAGPDGDRHMRHRSHCARGVACSAMAMPRTRARGIALL